MKLWPVDLVLEREEKALELFARGVTYDRIGATVGRLDSTGDLSREATRRLLYVAMWKRRIAVWGTENKTARAACVLYLACRKADALTRARLSEIKIRESRTEAT